MSLKHLKQTLEEMKEVKKDQQSIRQDMSSLRQGQDNLSETLDCYFWVLSRASLDGYFQDVPSDDTSSSAYRRRLVQRLTDLQYEYFACMSLASFLSHYGS
jgi:hypothetical protein